jgi:carbon-monoxide dehydrogenase medium subunit
VINDAGDHVLFGAAVRHRAVAHSDLVAAHTPLLRDACAHLGNMRVRATGSIGGNICFGDPRSDVLTTLFALGADVVLRSPRGERVLPVDQFALGMLETARAEDELLVAVRVAKQAGPHVYLRFAPAEYPTACVALVATTSGLRLVVGAVGERPHAVAVAAIDDLDADEVAAQVDVIEDLNGAEDYKRHITAVFVRRAIAAWREK